MVFNSNTFIVNIREDRLPFNFQTYNVTLKPSLIFLISQTN